MNHRTQILPGVYLTAVQSDKFKTGCFSLNLLRPMKKEEAAANALIPSVLLRGSVQKNAPTSRKTHTVTQNSTARASER